MSDCNDCNRERCNGDFSCVYAARDYWKARFEEVEKLRSVQAVIEMQKAGYQAAAERDVANALLGEVTKVAEEMRAQLERSNRAYAECELALRDALPETLHAPRFRDAVDAAVIRLRRLDRIESDVGSALGVEGEGEQALIAAAWRARGEVDGLRAKLAEATNLDTRDAEILMLKRSLDGLVAAIRALSDQYATGPTLRSGDVVATAIRALVEGF